METATQPEVVSVPPALPATIARSVLLISTARIATCSASKHRRAVVMEAAFPLVLAIAVAGSLVPIAVAARVATLVLDVTFVAMQ